MEFSATILKVKLAKEIGKKIAKDCSFVECAQEVMDAGARYG